MTTGYLPFLPQVPPHIGLPPEFCPQELLPLSATATSSLGIISPGTSLPYASGLALVDERKYDRTNNNWLLLLSLTIYL